MRQVQTYCLVGGGVIGGAIARALTAAGLSGSILDRGAFGSESSWAGAGLISALLPWDYPRPVSRLVEAGRLDYAAWASELARRSGVDPELEASGMLVLSPIDFTKASSWAQQSGARLDVVLPKKYLAGLVHGGNAIWLPDIAHVRNPRLMRALRSALLEDRVEILQDIEAKGFTVTGSRVAQVETSRGPHLADIYIVAVGAWTGCLLPELAPIIKPVRGQIVLLKGEPGRLPHVVYKDGLYVIPRRDGHILIGSTLEDVGFEKGITQAARHDLLARAIGILPFLQELPVVKQWAGLRPGSPDNIPIICRHPEIENLYICAGHYRYGVTMAPASARLMADLILGRDPFLDPTPYRWPV